jgi:carbonic anhydrase
MGKRYELVQFHFHRPSEERINGRGYEMVAHLVHKDLDGKLAVVAVLIEQGKGHPLVQQVWNNLPLEKNEELRAAEKMDLGALLPASRAYYTYMGSLTTPPCSEGVLWMVMKQPTQLSAEQIAIFAKLYPMNARPIQSTAGRLIKESVGTAATMSAAAP